MRGKELTGRGVFLWLAGLFGLMFIANGFFLYFAITSYRGEDVPKSYLQGIEYNDTIARRQAQAELGWTVKYDQDDTAQGAMLQIRITDKSGQAVTGLTVSGKLRHPTDQYQDIDVVFQKDGDGLYSILLPINDAKYRLRAQTGESDPPFVFELSL